LYVALRTISHRLESKHEDWLTAEDQAAALVSRLSEEAKQEVLDFARFLYTRKQTKQGIGDGKQSVTGGVTRT